MLYQIFFSLGISFVFISKKLWKDSQKFVHVNYLKQSELSICLMDLMVSVTFLTD